MKGWRPEEGGKEENSKKDLYTKCQCGTCSRFIMLKHVAKIVSVELKEAVKEIQ